MMIHGKLQVRTGLTYLVINDVQAFGVLTYIYELVLLTQIIEAG